MVEVKFTYPRGTGYPFKADRTRFENAAKEGINKFLRNKKVQEILKDPATIELVISNDKEITPMLPDGRVFLRPLEEVLAEWDALIEELKRIK